MGIESLDRFKEKWLTRMDKVTTKRQETDSLGTIDVPVGALYGAQTQRAVQNFALGGGAVPQALIYALADIKGHAAKVNASLGLLEAEVAEAIQRAAGAVLAGDHDDQFPVDLFQTGSGTSSNMNMNEVLANLASQYLELEKKNGVQSNDHVNLGQSSNDVIPASIQIATARKIVAEVQPALEKLAMEIDLLAERNPDVVKTGRTHLMDAVPLTLKQELDTWVFQVREHKARLTGSLGRLCQLPLGGTAIGTGINSHPDFGNQVCAMLSKADLKFRPCANLGSRIAGQEVQHEISALFEGIAITLIKICNDLRWMNSGPNSGLAEIRLPELQPGSSIMPGKVNPVIPEAVIMAMTQVMGYHTSNAIAAQSGNFQLNVMLPLIGANLIKSADLIINSAQHLADKAISGIEINRRNIDEQVGRNPILVTALNPIIGYEKAAEIAKQAFKEGRPVMDVAAENTDIAREELEKLLSPRNMT